MRHLLDSHTFLWWIADDSQLSPTVRKIIAASEHEILFSAASAWELVIKARLGRLNLSTDPAAFLHRQVKINGFVPLSITMEHAMRVADLPPLHRDPFDRILIAQAVLEDVPLLTADLLIKQYPVRVVW
jgi:PIN domain nuclease of toxin-antitoxin system